MSRKASTAVKASDSKSVKASPGSSGPSNVHPLTRVGQSDSLVNFVTGMGTGKDKTTATQFAFTAMDRQQVEAAYRGDWISRKIIDIPAYDATREWRSWEADTADITKLEETEKQFMLQRKTMSVLQRARLYGGAGLVLGVDQGNPSEPLDFDKLGKGCLKFVHLVNRYEITAGPIEWDITSPNFGTPSYYERQIPGGTSTPVRIDPSRFIRFIGAEIPDIQQSQGWGDSTLQIVADAVISLGTVTQAMTSLVQEAKTDIVKIPELSERIANTEYEARLKTRFAMANVMKSLYSVLLIDKEEEWERINQQFTGMPEVMQQFILMTCGAADIPATRFMGDSPKGLSATGDSDTRNYYDRVTTEQKVTIQPNLQPLDRLVVISTLGSEPDGLFYNWNPLWSMTEAEQADIELKKSQVMTADVNAALMDPMVLQKARENQLIESGLYPGLEQIIEEYGTDINEREAPVDPNMPTHIDPTTGEPAAPDAPGAIPNPAHPANQASNVVPISKGKAKPGASGTNTSQASGVPSKSVPGKKVAGSDEAIEAMATRIRDAQLIDGSTPRTLYIYRPVLNWRDIAKHYKAQGIDNVYGADMHVTVCYSKTPVDWLKVGEDRFGNDENGNLVVNAGGPRVNEQFGKYFVLAFANSDLSYRHCCVLERTDGSWDYEDYTPHVSISKDPGAVDPMKIAAYTGQIVLGPEVFEEIKVDGAMYDGAPAPHATPAVADAPVPIVVNVTVDGGKKSTTTRREIEYKDGRPVALIDTTTED